MKSTKSSLFLSVVEKQDITKLAYSVIIVATVLLSVLNFFGAKFLLMILK